MKFGTFNRFGGIGPENKLFATFLNHKDIINYSKLLNLALESRTKSEKYYKSVKERSSITSSVPMSLLSCRYLQSNHIRCVEAKVTICLYRIYATYSILRAAKSPIEGGKRPSSMLEDKSLQLDTKGVSMEDPPKGEERRKEKKYTV